VEDAAAGDGSPAAEKLGQQTGRKRRRWMGLGILWLEERRDERRGEKRCGKQERWRRRAGLPLYSDEEEREGAMWSAGGVMAGEGGKRVEAGVRLKNALCLTALALLSFP